MESIIIVAMNFVPFRNIHIIRIAMTVIQDYNLTQES